MCWWCELHAALSRGLSGFESASDLFTLLSPTGGAYPGKEMSQETNITPFGLLAFYDSEHKWNRCASVTMSAVRMRYWICGDPPESLRVSGQD